ncbi:MAG: Sec-independent protein translocase protein TatB [Pseudomonadota bacterium]
MSIGIGFAEMIVICVIALLVVGPERLPSLVRTVGRFVGRARRMAQAMQYELEREIDINDISGGSKTGAPGDTAATGDAASKVTPHPTYGHLPERAQAAEDLPPEDPLDDDVPTEGHADAVPPSGQDGMTDPDTLDGDLDLEPGRSAGETVTPLSADRRGG